MAQDSEPLWPKRLHCRTPHYSFDAEKTRPPRENIHKQNGTHRIYPVNVKESADVRLGQQARRWLDISQVAPEIFPSIVPSDLCVRLDGRHDLQWQPVRGRGDF